MNAEPRFVLFYLKLVEKLAYAEDFLDGRLYLNPVAYFRTLERAADGRADPHEGAILWVPPSPDLEVNVGGVRISPEDLAGPIVFTRASDDALNMLCLYGATTGEFQHVSADNIAAVRSHLRIPDKVFSMGLHAVVIANVTAFRERLIAAVKANDYALNARAVTYVDPDAHRREHTYPLFFKSAAYAWQREHRFVVDTRGDSAPAPLVLDVGSLRDICFVVPAEELGNIELDLPEEAALESSEP